MAAENFKVGDLIKATESEYPEGSYYGQGHIGKVVSVEEGGLLFVDFSGQGNAWVDDDGRWYLNPDHCTPYHPAIRVYVGDTIRTKRQYAGFVPKGAELVVQELDGSRGTIVCRYNGSPVLFDKLDDTFEVVRKTIPAPLSYPVGTRVQLKPTGGAFDSYAPVFAKVVDKDMECGEVVYTVVPCFGDWTRQRKVTGDGLIPVQQ